MRFEAISLHHTISIDFPIFSSSSMVHCQLLHITYTYTVNAVYLLGALKIKLIIFFPARFALFVSRFKTMNIGGGLIIRITIYVCMWIVDTIRNERNLL